MYLKLTIQEFYDGYVNGRSVYLCNFILSELLDKYNGFIPFIETFPDSLTVQVRNFIYANLSDTGWLKEGGTGGAIGQWLNLETFPETVCPVEMRRIVLGEILRRHPDAVFEFRW